MRKLSITILLLVIWAPIAPSAEHDTNSLNRLLSELRRAVPKGWAVSVNRFLTSNDGQVQVIGGDGVQVEVWRKEKVMFEPLVLLNANPFEPVTSNPAESFYFSFNLMEYLSEEDHARKTRENSAIEARLAEFTKTLADLKRDGKSRAFGDTRPHGYYPETKEQKKRLQVFIDYAKSHPKHDIQQDFYYERMSFGFFDPRDLTPLESKEIDAECTAVLKAIRTVLRPYQTAP